jgi:hypothetical protein
MTHYSNTYVPDAKILKISEITKRQHYKHIKLLHKNAIFPLESERFSRKDENNSNFPPIFATRKIKLILSLTSTGY